MALPLVTVVSAPHDHSSVEPIENAEVRGTENDCSRSSEK